VGETSYPPRDLCTQAGHIALGREWEIEGGPPRIGQRLPVRSTTHGLRRARGSMGHARGPTLPLAHIGEDILRRPRNAGTDTTEECGEPSSAALWTACLPRRIA